MMPTTPVRSWRMEIVWLGHSCFRIRGKEAVVVCDPCPPLATRSASLPPNIITINHPRGPVCEGCRRQAHHPPQRRRVRDTRRVYHGHRHLSRRLYGAEHGRNLAFVIEMERIRSCTWATSATPGRAGRGWSAATYCSCQSAARLRSMGESRRDRLHSSGEVRCAMHYKTEPTTAASRQPNASERDAGRLSSRSPSCRSANSIPSETQVIMLDTRARQPRRAP